jgi:hypothetical protein
VHHSAAALGAQMYSSMYERGMYTHTHTRTHTRMYMYVCVCVCVCMYMQMYSSMEAQIRPQGRGWRGGADDTSGKAQGERKDATVKYFTVLLYGIDTKTLSFDCPPLPGFLLLRPISSYSPLKCFTALYVLHPHTHIRITGGGARR